MIGHLCEFLKKAYSTFKTVVLVGLFHAFNAIRAGSTGFILDRIDCIIYYYLLQEVAFADCVKRDQMKKCLANFLLLKKMDFQFINIVW